MTELLQEAGPSQSASKKAKKEGYQLESEIAVLIDEDRLNSKLWDECKEALGETKQVKKSIIKYFIFFQIWN